MSFFNEVAKVFSLGTEFLKSGLGFFSEIGNLFTSLFGNNSANAPNASQTATTVTQQDDNLTVTGTTDPGETARLNQLFSVMRTEQGATPTT